MNIFSEERKQLWVMQEIHKHGDSIACISFDELITIMVAVNYLETVQRLFTLLGTLSWEVLLISCYSKE